MVKVADMERNDVTVRFLLFLDRLLHQSEPLARRTALAHIRDALTTHFFPHFPHTSPASLPSLTLVSRCTRSADIHPFFGAQFDPTTHTVRVCLDSLRDPLALQEAVLREMSFAALRPVLGAGPEEELMRRSFASCRFGMASVYGKEWPGLSVASAVCAKYSFRERAGKASRGGWDRVRVLGREE